MNKTNTIIIIIGISFLAALLFYVRFYDHQIPVRIISFLIEHAHVSVTKFEYRLYGAIIIFFASTIGLSIAYLYLQPPAPRTSHGTAAWADNSDLPTGEGVALGKAGSRTITSKYHTLVTAPSRSGKGVSSIIPNLLDHPGSCIVLDIKGENHAITAKEREKYGNVYVLDPFNIANNSSNSYNWLDSIDIKNEDCISQAEMLTEMITANATDSYFDSSAQDLIRGLILYTCYKADLSGRNELRNLRSVREFLTSPNIESIIEDMSSIKNDIFGVLPRISSSLITASQKGAGKELSAVINSARRFTTLLDDPRIIKTIESSNFNIMDIKNKVFTVYIIIPPSKLEQCRGYVRSLFGLALQAITKDNYRPKHNVLFLLDEFPQLGHMENIENAISLVSGYGGQFLIYIQDLSQLKAVYKKADTFLGNSNRVFFGCSDYDTAKYISNSLGKKTIETRNTSISQGKQTISISETGRDLLTPEEIMQLDRDKMILFLQGEKPALLKKIVYYNDKAYIGRFDRNPFI